MPYKQMRHAMSNTLALQVFLERHAKHPDLVGPAIEVIEDFSDKYRPDTSGLGFYGLMDESQLASETEKIGEVFNAVLAGEKPYAVRYVGLEDLRRSRAQQLEVYRLIMRSTFSKLIMTGNDRCREHLGDEYPRLEKSLRLALGTYKLQQILDQNFGNPFSKTVKNNILAVMRNYCCAVVVGDAETASRYGAVSMVMRRTMPIGVVGADGVHELLSFVEHSTPAKIGEP